MLSRGKLSVATWRRVSAAFGALLCVVLAANPAAAEDAGTATPAATVPPAIGQATPGTVLCQVTNKDLDHVTGIAMGSNGTIYAVESPSDTGVVEVWTVNQSTCEATKKRYGFQPRNPQDVAVAADGSIWVLDIVDGRAWITFEKVADPSSNAAAVPYRAGKASADTPINGTALLLQADGSPIVIAATNSKGVLYRPGAPMQPNTDKNLPPLTQLGEFTPINTGTGSGFDRLLVSAAAISPDRSRVVVRTKADAYEFKIGDNGDVAAAITTGTPVITPLPGEENGQSIAYSADGATFLTLDGGESPKLRSYTPYVPPAATQAAAPAGGGAGLDFGDITNIALATGLLGLAAVIAGIVGIVRFRRQGRLDDEDGYGDGYDRPRPPRPRSGGGRAPVRVGGPPPGDGRGPDGHGRGSGGHDQGQGYGSGQSYAPSPGGGGQVYGSGQGGGGSQGYGGGGQSYAPGPGGPVYGSGQGGQSQGSGQAGGTVYGGGQGGGRTYGRARRPDDEPPTRRGGYGHDDTP